MADFFDVNTKPLTKRACLYKLITTFLAAFPTGVKASGDGLAAYSSTGSVFTTGATGATGFGNDLAWARLQFPDGRELLVVNNSTGAPYSCSLLLSQASHFTGGSPSATVWPTATDTQVILGGTTSGSASNWMQNDTDGTLIANCYVNSADPYDLYLYVFPSGNSSPHGLIFIDAVQGLPAGDNFKHIYGAGITTLGSSQLTGLCGFMGTGPGWEPNTTMEASGGVAPSSSLGDPANNKHQLLQRMVFATSNSSRTYVKGWGSNILFDWHGATSPNNNALNLNGTKDRITASFWNFKWNGSTPVVV